MKSIYQQFELIYPLFSVNIQLMPKKTNTNFHVLVHTLELLFHILGIAVHIVEQRSVHLLQKRDITCSNLFWVEQFLAMCSQSTDILPDPTEILLIWKVETKHSLSTVLVPLPISIFQVLTEYS